MNPIQTINPEEFLEENNVQIFMVIWTNSQGIFFGTGGGGFSSALHGGQMDSPAVERHNAVQEYYNLVNVARSHQFITDGRVDLIALPVYAAE